MNILDNRDILKTMDVWDRKDILESRFIWTSGNIWENKGIWKSVEIWESMDIWDSMDIWESVDNLELKLRLQASQDLLDATLENKNYEIKQANTLNRIQLYQSENGYTKTIMPKDKEIGKLKHHINEMENEFIDYNTK